MEKFEFKFDEQSLEVFPSEIWSDPCVIFHGTSSWYSERIDADGLTPSFMPFDLDAVRGLLEHIESDSSAIKEYESLNHYIDYRTNGTPRISFSPISGACIRYSTGHAKGGQIFGQIISSQKIIASSPDGIPSSIRDLFGHTSTVQGVNGVIYAIRLANMDGIKAEHGTIQSSRPIRSEEIIAKVVVPDEAEQLIVGKVFGKKITEKLLKCPSFKNSLPYSKLYGGFKGNSIEAT